MAPSVSMRCKNRCRIRGHLLKLFLEKCMADLSNLVPGELQTDLDHHESAPVLYLQHQLHGLRLSIFP